MNQQQVIEILVKLRDEAARGIAQLGGDMKGLAGESEKAGASHDRLAGSQKRVSDQSVALGVVVGNLATMAGRGLVNAFQSCIAEANKLDSGLVGLSSVAKAFDQDAGLAKKAAVDLASDGLMSVGDAAAGLKNLLASGFSLDQATELMMRFKDAAAFGRQGSLEFGEAIKGATEGIKNGNSTLVDNAGITKNLSQMLVEAGYAATDLSKAGSDVNVRMAIFNGIVKEAGPQLGDTARYLETAAGKQAQFGAAVRTTQQQIGKELQPVLGNMLSILGPLTKVVGENADTVVRLGLAATGVVGPILAVKAAAALGAGSLDQMATAGVRAVSVFQGVRTWQDARAGIQLLGEAAGITYAKLGLLGSAAAVAGAGFAGWNLGRAIGELTGATDAVRDATVYIGNLGDRQQVAAHQQDVITQAIKSGAAANISYSDAVKHNADVEIIRQGLWNKSAEAQLASVDAQLRLKRITEEQANAQRRAIEAEREVAATRANRLSLSEALEATEKKVNDSIAATGYTIGELTRFLDRNEAGFKSWAKQHKLSEDAVDAVERALRRQKEAHKDAEQAAQKQAEEIKKLDADLVKMGITTAGQVNTEFQEFIAALKRATASGVPFGVAMANLYPILDDLYQRAVRSGTATRQLTEEHARFVAMIRATAPQITAPWIGLDQVLKGLPGRTSLATRDAAVLGMALKTAGLDSMASVQKAKQEAEQAYRDIVQLIGAQSPQAVAAYRKMVEAQIAATTDAGTAHRLQLQLLAKDAEEKYQQIAMSVGRAAPEAIEAYQEMVNAQMIASGRIPTIWRTQIMPNIVDVIKTVQTAVNGSFAQMLLGAKGFKDGFTDIWESLKSGAINVMNQILSAFMNQFLTGMINAMRGQKGAFSSAFAGFFSGGGGGQGGIPGLGMFGGGGGAGDGRFGPDLSGMLTGKGAPGAAGAGPNWGQIAGGGVIAATGAMGLMHAQGGLANTLAGAQTGAGIGMMFGGPMGAGIGAGIGALGGFIKSKFGNATKGGRAEFAKSVGYDNVDDMFAELQRLQGEAHMDVGADELLNRARNVIGKNDKAGNEKWMSDVQTAFERIATRLEQVNKDAQELGLTWADMGEKMRAQKLDEHGEALVAQTNRLVETGYEYDKVIAKQAGSYSQLLERAFEFGEQIPESMKPVIERLSELGLLVDENGNKIILQEDQLAESYKNLASLKEQLAQAGTDTEKEELNKKIAALEDYIGESKKKIEKYQDGMFDPAKADVDEFHTELRESADVAEAVRDKIRRIFDELDIHVPVTYDYPDGTSKSGKSSGRKPGGAASGIFASHPTLAVFGEGGEPELGGPVDFMAKALAGALSMVGGQQRTAGVAAGGATQLTIQINTSDPKSMDRYVREDFLPMLTAVLRSSGQARAGFVEALGV